MIEGSYQLGLSDVLDQNLSCYEYFYSLPKSVQNEIQQRDLGSFEEIQDYVASRHDRAGIPHADEISSNFPQQTL